MKQFKFIFFTLLIFSTLFTTVSCHREDPLPPVSFDGKVLVLNQGNFTEHSASLSLFDETSMNITNGIYENANGISLGATIVSGVVSSNKEAYIVCNNPDKIDIIDASSGKIKSTITESLANPRNMIYTEDRLYVTNWDYSYIENEYGWWEFNQSYVAIYNTTNNTFITKIAVGTDAEGIALYANRLFVAVKEGVRVYDVSTQNITLIKTVRADGVTGGAKHLVFDKLHQLWASFPDKGVISIDPGALVANRVVEVPVDYMDGFITTDGKGEKVYTYNTLFDANYNPEKATVYSVDISSGGVKEVFSGTSFYGVGVSPYTGNIFVAETNFVSNSVLKVVDINGSVKSTATAGIGTYRYLFF